MACSVSRAPMAVLTLLCAISAGVHPFSNNGYRLSGEEPRLALPKQTSRKKSLEVDACSHRKTRSHVLRCGHRLFRPKRLLLLPSAQYGRLAPRLREGDGAPSYESMIAGIGALAGQESRQAPAVVEHLALVAAASRLHSVRQFPSRIDCEVLSAIKQ